MNKFFKNKYTRIILGVLWGLGLSCIFRQACNGRNCIIYKAPKPEQVKNKIFAHEEKCYKYKTQKAECNDEAIVH